MIETAVARTVRRDRTLPHGSDDIQISRASLELGLGTLTQLTNRSAERSHNCIVAIGGKREFVAFTSQFQLTGPCLLSDNFAQLVLQFHRIDPSGQSKPRDTRRAIVKAIRLASQVAEGRLNRLERTRVPDVQRRHTLLHRSPQPYQIITSAAIRPCGVRVVASHVHMHHQATLIAQRHTCGAAGLTDDARRGPQSWGDVPSAGRQRRLLPHCSDDAKRHTIRQYSSRSSDQECSERPLCIHASSTMQHALSNRNWNIARHRINMAQQHDFSYWRYRPSCGSSYRVPVARFVDLNVKPHRSSMPCEHTDCGGFIARHACGRNEITHHGNRLRIKSVLNR